MVRQVPVVIGRRQTFTGVESVDFDVNAVPVRPLSGMVFESEQTVSTRHAEFDDADPLQPQPVGELRRTSDTVGVGRPVDRSDLDSPLVGTELSPTDELHRPISEVIRIDGEGGHPADEAVVPDRHR